MLIRFARATQLLAVLFVLPSLLVACATSPVSIAQTPAQKYAAVKLTYDAVLAVAVPVIEDTAVPINVRRSLQTAVAESGEIFGTLNDAYVQYVAARAELGAAETTSERLEVATRNLERWLAALDETVLRIASLAR